MSDNCILSFQADSEGSRSGSSLSLRNVASSATPAVAAPSGNGVLILSVYCPYVYCIFIV